MKKKHVLLVAFAAAMLTPTVVWAQYPQITDEAKANYTKMMTEERKRSDEAWEKALPIVLKEAKEGRPYISWAGRPYDLPQARIPSFPGAEGGGMYSFGGRGGKVITVTNLNDRGPGSFREACETGGARIIVFNVAGIIRLESPIIVRAPYVTIAGQTAPGDGVCIAGESFWVDTHDVVVRHMRFRRGETKGSFLFFRTRCFSTFFIGKIFGFTHPGYDFFHIFNGNNLFTFIQTVGKQLRDT